MLASLGLPKVDTRTDSDSEAALMSFARNCLAGISFTKQLMVNRVVIYRENLSDCTACKISPIERRITK